MGGGARRFGVGFAADYAIDTDPAVQRLLPMLPLRLPVWLTVHREIPTARASARCTISSRWSRAAGAGRTARGDPSMNTSAWFEGFESRRITTAGAEIALRTGGDRPHRVAAVARLSADPRDVGASGAAVAP